jgi:hypothetical protein
MFDGCKGSKQTLHPGADLIATLIIHAIGVVEPAAWRIPSMGRTRDVSGIDFVAVFFYECKDWYFSG